MGTPTHWLRANENEWTPRHVGFLDTETTATGGDGRETLALRLWVYGAVDRRSGQPGPPAVHSSSGRLRTELARTVDRSMVGKRVLWIYAHNLAFDISTSRLPEELVNLGWDLGELTFTGRSARVHLSRKSKSIWLLDSWSWLTASLEQIGRAVGRPKLPMPAWSASEEEWEAYCAGDVLVLAEAMLTCMRWWDDHQLGHWSRSGPSCGWNALRHLSPNRRVLVVPDPQQQAHDRLAIRGGRRDATRVGVISGGPFAILDFANAHLTVAAHCRLPMARNGWHEQFPLEGQHYWTPNFGICAEAEVETRVPRYPLRTERGVFYPVGRFRTVLCRPELEWARENGDLRRIGPGYTHAIATPLQAWARWALEQIDPKNADVPPIVKMMIKQWGRSVIGKFAGRTSRREDRGPALFPSWTLERGTLGLDHLPTWDLHAGGHHWFYVGDQEGENSYPAVLAWIESYVRVALGRMLECFGEQVWVVADTDGCVVDLMEGGAWLARRLRRKVAVGDPQRLAERLCEAVAPLTWPLVPRVKSTSDSLTVTGPQHWAADRFVKAAGVPGRPERDAEGGLHWWMWPGLGWQLQEGSQEGYVRIERGWTAPRVAVNRWVTPRGRCEPVEADLDESGHSHILARGSWRLGPEQSPALAGLWHPERAEAVALNL